MMKRKVAAAAVVVAAGAGVAATQPRAEPSSEPAKPLTRRSSVRPAPFVCDLRPQQREQEAREWLRGEFERRLGGLL